MAKINTLNYQTVASWNGSQDLFVVEQPDGTKVATPEQVKQFVEAGNFTGTGEITDGHGNILKDMAKSDDMIAALAGKQDTLTFDNAPTTGSNNPVKSDGVKTYVDNAVIYKAGDTIPSENVVAAAIGSSLNNCWFSIPISKPIVANSISISNVTCVVYYGSNQKAEVRGATYSGFIKRGSILINMSKANTFTENARYIVDFMGTFTFS